MKYIKLIKTAKNKTITLSSKSMTIPKSEYNNADTISLYFKDATEEEVNGFLYQRDGRNLLIINNDQIITVTDYFSTSKIPSTNSKVKYIKYMKDREVIEKSIIDEGFINSGYTDFVPKKGKINGTMFSDVISMKDAHSYKKSKGYTINGKKGNDEITGSSYSDTIIGGKGTNTINFDFNETFGQDTIKLTKGETLILNLTKGETQLNCEDVSFGKIGKNLIIYLSESGQKDNYICVKNFFSSSVDVLISDKEIREFLSENTAVLNIIGHGKINGTKYGDSIYGSEKNDTITAGLGDDYVYTMGGNDTVVETGAYGHDVIESDGSIKVTVKLSEFDSDKISKDEYGNLVYTTDDNSSFIYNDFYNNEIETADLWIKLGKKSYHIINNDKETDFSADKNNKIIYSSADSYVGSKNTKNLNTVYGNGLNNYTYQGGNERYVDNELTSDNYKVTLTKNGALTVKDNGGDDSLSLTNSLDSISLFFDINIDGTIGKDLVIYNTQSMSYKALQKAYKNNNFVGAVKLENYFSNGKVEIVNYVNSENKTDLDMSGWGNYVNNLVLKWLKENNKNSVGDVLLSGTKKEKKALIELLKNSTYEDYQQAVNSFDKYSEADLVNNTSELVLDDNGRLMTVVVDSENEVSYKLGNNNQITFNQEFSSDKTISTAEGSHDVLVYTDKAYADFYTKTDALIAYNSGDPLIIKDGNDLNIGDTKIENIDGLNAEIMIKDKNQETKTIVIGKTDIEGTFESEIIVGSNFDDNITTNGGNDLIYMGDGNDTLYVTALEKGKTTGKNTAQMTGIGGTTTISDDLKCPAISVYDNSGNDTYNTSFDFGLYIEDYEGKDTVNITYSDKNIMYFFDVLNPNKEGNLYTDLMICDKDAFSSALIPVSLSIMMGKMTAKQALESMQGSFGYVWMDDFYSESQEIETVNLVDEGKVVKTFKLDYEDETSDLYSVAQAVAGWLSKKNYSTAWDVLENGSKSDMAALLNLYMNS